MLALFFAMAGLFALSAAPGFARPHGRHGHRHHGHHHHHPGGGQGGGGQTGGGGQSGGGGGTGGGGTTPPPADAESRSLDGSANNAAHPAWGQAGTQYRRIAPANYADGRGAMVSGPSARYVSNRIFNDLGQNIFSENGVSQWGWAWGQFIDHDIGLRDETPAESDPLAFSATDPLERFTNDFGAIDFSRTPASPGTGTTTPRQQTNTISSFIDASNVYGSSASREEWLRQGSIDGNPTDNQASMLLPGGYLPRATERGDAAAAPAMDLMGALTGQGSGAAVAGDVRANENIALTAIHTLFVREHNRIVSLLPASLSDEQRFQIARRVVGAESQYITYHDFLPAMGVTLDSYRGYDPSVNPSLSNEFATVGYRAHSQVHGEFDVDLAPDSLSQAQLDMLSGYGITHNVTPDAIELTVPLAVAYGNPDLLQFLGEGPVLKALSGEREYRNDEQIDDSMRSVLFQVPKPGIADPSVCGSPAVNPDCYSGVADLGAIDIERGRDHGMPSYNDLRRAYGLSPVSSFTQITGEPTQSFPANDPAISTSDPIDDPDILEFTHLWDANGNTVQPGTEAAREDVTRAVRRTTLAARLKAIYGTPDKLDAFVGMVSEKHVPGTEFGPLQLAIWKRQFEALRDGDRFFYANDPELARIRSAYGIDYRHSLADLIGLDAGGGVQPNVFKAPAN